MTGGQTELADRCQTQCQRSTHERGVPKTVAALMSSANRSLSGWENVVMNFTTCKCQSSSGGGHRVLVSVT